NTDERHICPSVCEGGPKTYLNQADNRDQGSEVPEPAEGQVAFFPEYPYEDNSDTDQYDKGSNAMCQRNSLGIRIKDC
ncbi:MAG: hypothetical protein ACYSYT_08930, partial [Planctomycetota bacterium]